MKEDRCVMCGEVVPEGRQVCVKCDSAVQKIPEPKGEKGHDESR